MNLVSTKDMPYEKWLEYRKKGIGGSDAGAICGLNPYASPVSVWADKKGKMSEKEDSEAMRQGRDLENYVAERFCEATGKKVRRHNFIIQHDTYPFMLANVDRLIVGEKAGLECKTANAYGASKWEGDTIPAHYEIQCHHYMAVTGMESWYIACVILGRGFVWHKIDRDEEIIRNLETIEKEFWDRYIVGDKMPDPDGSDAYDAILKEYYPKDNGEAIKLYGFDDKIDRIFEINSLVDRLEKEKNEIEQAIKCYMQDAQQAESDSYRVTWKASVSNRIDSKLLRKEQPSIYQRYAKPSESRRFTIKNLKED